ncbi:aminotransferase class I/II-fold pyridoxal phosphate-dependent enzyme [Natroniella sulfidigena]|uniref:O-acetylhomoserine aminocarboxypropyltransferase/cysteine synthase family protein n=1 Tax=Natroniella sulfidigena TaxID=723921 RepID=UPI00200A94C0|nr:aminotransferase class I/II-fold pyridoxal phosphate-dependent enzyme [Natroniella sulfidigena]MCK8816113.1 aminotransferase class I/II-fold pyridoxal phosphate-dependent enzyme [Natroniella sulfidigena]
MKFSTKLVNLKVDNQQGATNTPVYLTNSFEYERAEDLEKVFNQKAPGYVYTRVNNPSIRKVEEKLASLEGGKSAILSSSGMSAIATATLAILEQGDEFIATSSLFGGTYNLFKSYKNYGIEPKFAAGVEREDIAELITEQTKFVFAETLGNPKLDIPDLKGIAQLCQEHGIALIIDSTMTTPSLIKPLELGADLVIHSTSKYINGTANSIGGVIIDGGSFDWTEFDNFAEYKRYGKFAFTVKARGETFRNLGVCQSPLDSFLNELGLPTLALRMERHCQNALELAKFLAEQPEVKEVNYPGLEDNDYHQRANELLAGGYGGVLTLRVGSKKKAFTVINNLDYFYNLANIGDVKSLVIHPASTIYANNSEQERQELGVYDDLIRVSVGIEDISDLKEDFVTALEEI